MINEKSVPEWKNQTEIIIESVEMCCLDLNKWEVEFVDSIELQLSQDRELSFKQSSILRKIYGRIE